MTSEKAIEILKEIKSDFENKCCTSIDLGNIEAIDKAISALEKQIPKMRTGFRLERAMSFDFGREYICAVCGKKVWISDSEQWVYKTSNPRRFMCSYTCFRKWQRAKRPKRSKNRRNNYG